MLKAQPDWVSARLFTTAGLRGAREQEVRASSALMSILGAVPIFSHSVLKTIGAPGGRRIETYTEAILRARGGGNLRPDGVILVSRAQRTWGCLVEVKTGRAALTKKQVENYIRLARKHGFDAVLTVSNELSGRPDELPYELNKVVQGKIDVHHLSWWRILTEARRCQHEKRIGDPDQAWLLGELIRYLADPRSRCAALDGMGANWAKVRDGVRAQTISRREPGLLAVVQRWEQLIEYISLKLSQELGTDVTQRLSPIPEARHKRAIERLLNDGLLRGEIRVKDAAAPMILEADLRAGQTRAAARITAPEKGQARGRIGWLLRQLKEAPGDLRVDVLFERAQRTQGTTLAKAHKDAELLRFSEDRLRPPRRFTISATRPMGRGSGRGRRAFVDATIGLATGFYRDTLQGIRAWQPSPPRLPEDEAVDDTSAKESTLQAGTGPGSIERPLPR
jgi:hypothetical protein